MNVVADCIRKVCPAVMIPSKSKTESTRIQELVYELKVIDAATKNVITIGPETLMSELREILRSSRISGVPVVDGDKLIGIISIEDFINWLAGDRIDCPVRDKVTCEVKTLYADEPLIYAVCKLEQTGFGRFPVINRKDGKLMGIITKADIIERLLQKLEIDYQEEEIHRYRASHIFEDIVADKVLLTVQSYIKGKDFELAGQASSSLRKTLQRLGVHPQIIRRAVIASYEAEMNVVIYADGGDVAAQVRPDQINIFVNDSGPGIEDIEKAMQPGYSTAPDWVRELGFGAGMGLVNIKKCADKMELTSKVGQGTHLKISIDIKDDLSKSKAG